MKYFLFTFSSTKNSLIASSLLNELCTNMPILREISSNCGVALKVSPENKDNAISIISSNFDDFDYHIYEVNGFGNSKIITFIQ